MGKREINELLFTTDRKQAKKISRYLGV